MSATPDKRKALVLFKGERAGVLEETEGGYRFLYDLVFAAKNIPISVSLPIKTTPYESAQLFPFCLGLLPEGWYLEIIVSRLKIDKTDVFGLLCATCKDTVGAVSIEALQ